MSDEVYIGRHLKKTIKFMAENGFSRSEIESLYLSGLSKKDITSKINELREDTVITYRSFIKVFEYYEIPNNERDQALRDRAKMISDSHQKKERLYAGKYTKNDLVEMSKSGLSIRLIREKTGVAAVTISKILKAAGIEVKRDIPAVETIEDLKDAGYTKDVIEDLYCTQNLSFNRVKEILSDAIGRSLGDKALSTILKKLEIKKSKEQLIERRGAKSRAELDSNLLKLKKVGFESLQELANHYDENKSLTREALLKSMNEKLDENEELFTQRWLTRHMDPLLSEDRLRGVSRVELEFIEFLKSVTSEDIIENSRSIIKPYELDAVIPSLSIAFEFNGDYWHSDKFLTRNHGMTSEEYHKMKFDKCEDLGIRLYFVWESDWVNDRVSVEAEILSILRGTKDSDLLKKFSLL